MKTADIENFEVLDIEDRGMIDGYNIFSQIDISGYDYIFIPNMIDQHKDHKAVSVLLYNLLKSAKRKSNLTIMFYEVWSPLTFATKCIDISDFIETKKQMLECYNSQTSQRSYYEAAIALSKYRGLAKEMNYAESFWAMNVTEFSETIETLYKELI
jgi:LmbE family N-acetylglucosaminyl deacetylase